MRIIELSALGIVALFIWLRARYGPEPRAFLVRIALLVVASFIAEDSCIRAYGFYAYAPDWSLFVDQVPLAILLIWPIVIHSAWELAGYLLGPRRQLSPLLGAALVFADAWMIEPISVQAGLWWWNEPGLFAVPPIGVLGWALHAGFCMWVFEQQRRRDWPLLASAAAVVIAPVGTHLCLLASWWGLLRWINVPLPPWPAVAVLWAIALGLTFWAVATRARTRVPPRDMWSRLPAALFFFVLLALYARDVPALVAWALAFAPPYLALTRWPSRADATARGPTA